MGTKAQPAQDLIKLLVHIVIMKQMPKHSLTSAYNVTYRYNETKETNRNNGKNQTNRRFFIQFFAVIMDVDSIACFNAII